jgi:CHAD domain-containing protein
VGPTGGREGRASGAAIAPLRALLEAAGEPAATRVDPAVAAAVAAALEGARHDLRRLHAAARDAGGDLEPLGRGLRRMHRRARAAAAVAAAGAGAARDDALHDARKRFKELGYVMRWWAPAWRGPIEAWLAEADALGDLIGADHDQVVLRSRLPALEGAVDGEILAQVLVGSERRSARLRAKAGRSLTRLAAEPSDAFVARHLAYLAAARALRAPRGGA